MRAVRLLALHLHDLRPAAQPVGLQLGAADIGDHQGGVRGGGAHRVAPLRRPPAGKAPQLTIMPVAADRQLHRQRAGMGMAVDAGRRRRAAIDDQHAAAGLQALEAAIGRATDGAAPAARRPGVSTSSTSVRRLLLAAVEQRQAAVAVAQHAQRRRHALDRAGQRRRRLHLRRLQQRADFGQVLQRRQLRGGAALGVAAVGQHLAGDLLRQEAQRAGQERGVLRQRHGGGDQPLQRGQRPGVQLLGRQRGGQAAGVGHQPRHQPLAEHVVGGGGEEVVMAEPGGDARAGDVRPMRQRLGRRGGDPVGDQGAGAQPGGVGAERAQVAQPGEAVRRGAQRLGAAGVAPSRRASAARTAPPISSSPLSSRAPRVGVAGPGIAHRQGGRVGHARHAAGWAGGPSLGERRAASDRCRSFGALP